MRYLVKDNKRSKTLAYQRRWPTGLQEAAKAAGYGTLCKLRTACPVAATELEKAEARELADKEYDRIVSLLRVADNEPTGMLIVGPNTGLSGRMRRDAKRKAVQKAMPKHDLFGLLHHYHLAHPEEGRAKRYRESYWESFCAHMGTNVAAISKSLPAIHAGLDSWQEDMESRGLKGSSIERQRNSVTAVLNWANLRYRLDWHLKLRPVAKQKAKPKATLSVEEQKRLLELVVAEPGPNTAMAAVMLAGGVMPSEIGRLDPEATTASLSAHHPYIVIGGDGEQVKAEARRRIIPIVWPAEVTAVIRRYLPEAIERSRVSSDPTATVNKWLRTRGFAITGHGLRHTMAAAAGAAMANPIALARVGGWSGSGLNPVMLGYGTGAEDSELVASLSAEVRRWWKHLLPEEGLRVVASAGSER